MKGIEHRRKQAINIDKPKEAPGIWMTIENFLLRHLLFSLVATQLAFILVQILFITNKIRLPILMD